MARIPTNKPKCHTPTRALKRSAAKRGRPLKPYARELAADDKHPLHVSATLWLARK